VLDNEVLTENIEGVTLLSLNSLDISDLTGIEGFTSLETLACTANNLESIDVSANTNLKSLFFAENSVNSIDLSSNLLLETLSTSANGLEEIDLTNLLNLKVFYGRANLFTEIDFSNCADLEEVHLSSNLLTHLDLSNNTNLTLIDCSMSDELIFLSLKNGNNVDIGTYNSTDCPMLTCVEVDVPDYSTAAWLDKDPSTIFNTSCGLGIGANSAVQVSVYPNPTSENLYIQTSEENTKYQLVDIAGKSLHTGQLSAGKSVINVNDLPVGVYFLELMSENYNNTHKIIIN
jgi:hypothetical protein